MNQETLYALVRQINTDYLGPVLVFALLGAGAFFTIRLHFVPQYFWRAIKAMFAASHPVFVTFWT